MKNFLSVGWIFVATLCLQSCATIRVKGDVEGVGFNDPGHLEWWNDSIPRVIMLHRICDGSHPEFLIPGPEPKIALRLERENSLAVFHDNSLACAENPPLIGDSLRLVVSRNPIAMGASDSIVLLGRLGRNEYGSSAYSLGKDTAFGKFSDNKCPDSSWCMRDGAVIRYRTHGRVYSLVVQERLHPELSPWARSKKIEASLGYLYSVPVDILLSPVYIIAFPILMWMLKDFNPWH